MPSTPYDAKGLLIASVEDDNPVVCIESRWLYNVFGDVPEGYYRVPLGRARVVRPGRDLTVIAMSYLVLEAVRAAEALAGIGIEVEVVDVQTLNPLDRATLLASVRKTRHLVVADTGWKTGGFGAELTALAAEEAFESLKRPVRRLGMPDCPIPSSPALATLCYPGAADVVAAVGEVLRVPTDRVRLREPNPPVPADVPHTGFTGPF